jgi:dynactin-5
MSSEEPQPQEQQQEEEEENAEEQGYIKTTTHNFVSRKATLEGPRQVEIKGRSIVQAGVKIRGDLAIVRIGRYCEIDEGTLLEPPPHNLTANKHIPMAIGPHTRIGKGCEIRAAAIGSLVWIGDDVKIGKRCILKDNCIVETGVVLGDDTVVPPFTLIPKNGTYLDQTELPPSMALQMQELSLDRFQEFRQAQRDRQ